MTRWIDADILLDRIEEIRKELNNMPTQRSYSYGNLDETEQESVEFYRLERVCEGEELLERITVVNMIDQFRRIIEEDNIEEEVKPFGESFV